MKSGIREIISDGIENISNKLNLIVDYLYNNPESSFNEEKASSLLCELLGSYGFNIEKDAGGIKYSFKAEYGTSSPKVAYICEYNAVENLGHICGHNISSAINTGAAIGLKNAVDEIGGSVIVIGCPAEDRYHTKIEMQKKGIFDRIDAVICGHAMDKTCESGSSLAMTLIDFTFKGRAAHTSINFREGTDALCPCVMLFNLVETLKSRYPGSLFINGIIKNGGKDIDLIPDETKCTFMIKAADMDKLNTVCKSIAECAEFASKHYNCSVEYEYPKVQYMPLKTNSSLSKTLCHNLKEKGILEIHGPITVPASLDIGNISQYIPTVHPYIGICRPPVKYYTKEFSDSTITPYAKKQMIKAACALSLTGADIILKPEILKGQDLS